MTDTPLSADEARISSRPASGSSKPSVRDVVVRLAAGVFGGWAWTFGQTSLGVAIAAGKLGMPFEDAKSLLEMIAFPIFVAILCWVFVARSTIKVWALLLGGGLLMALGGWGLGR